MSEFKDSKENAKNNNTTYHVPVMLDEVIKALNIKKDGFYFDGTLGGGGHSHQILKNGGRLIATDRDIDAIKECQNRFKGFEKSYTLIKGNFKNARQYFLDYVDASNIDILNEELLDGALLDLGISSHQIDTPERGMSYRFDTRLDMRMDISQSLSAETIVNTYSQDELNRIIFKYGEERFARKITASIVKERAKQPILSTGRLIKIITDSVPKSYHKNPAMRTFMALRIEVNNELKGLDKAITDIFDFLKQGARLCVISFHSLEDRIVKQTMAKLSEGCICDKALPVCVCGNKPKGKLLGKKKASEEELNINRRSASATLRIIEKL